MVVDKFLNEDGLIMNWPSKHANKRLIIAYLANKFDLDKIYSEHEVNEILKQWHTFQDWPLLRRSLIDYGFMSRDREGLEYKKVTN